MVIIKVPRGIDMKEGLSAPKENGAGKIQAFAQQVIVLAFFICPLLQACVHKGLPEGPAVRLPPSFSYSGSALIPDRWWLAFGDGTLNTLVDKALKGNFSLRMAWDRLDQALAVAKREGADLWPQVEGSFKASRSVQRTTSPITGRHERTYLNEFLAGLSVSYELDLWGRVRSSREAAILDTKATLEDLKTAAITLSAEVARTWYRLMEAKAQLGLLDEQLDTDEKYLEVITLKFQRGQVALTDVLQQRQLVEAVRGKRLVVEANVDVLKNQLAVLLGQVPGTLYIQVQKLWPELQPPPKTGIPAELIRRRPDVRSAELRLMAQDKRVAASIAELFPRLSITANAQTSSQRIRDLFDNWLATLAGNLLAPIFEGGRRRAEVKRERALLSERLNAYREAILNAIREVEDALAREIKQRRYLESLSSQIELSREATRRAMENYTKGVGDFTRYLTTLLSHQELQGRYIEAKRDLFLYRIDLYRSLAGGFELRRPVGTGGIISHLE